MRTSCVDPPTGLPKVSVGGSPPFGKSPGPGVAVLGSCRPNDAGVGSVLTGATVGAAVGPLGAAVGDPDGVALGVEPAGVGLGVATTTGVGVGVATTTGVGVGVGTGMALIELARLAAQVSHEPPP